MTPAQASSLYGMAAWVDAESMGRLAKACMQALIVHQRSPQPDISDTLQCALDYIAEICDNAKDHHPGQLTQDPDRQSSRLH